MGRNSNLKKQRREARKKGLKLPAGKDKRYMNTVLKAAQEGREAQISKPAHWQPESMVEEDFRE